MNYDKIKTLSEKHPEDSNLKHALKMIDIDRKIRHEAEKMPAKEKAETIAELDNSKRLSSKTIGMYIKRKYGV